MSGAPVSTKPTDRAPLMNRRATSLQTPAGYMVAHTTTFVLTTTLHIASPTSVMGRLPSSEVFSAAPSTLVQTGSRSDSPEALLATGTATARTRVPSFLFLHPLCRGAQTRLKAAHIDSCLQHGVPKMTHSASKRRASPTSSRGSTIASSAGPTPCPCPRCWLWPPPRRSAACKATRRSANESTI